MYMYIHTHSNATHTYTFERKTTQKQNFRTLWHSLECKLSQTTQKQNFRTSWHSLECKLSQMQLDDLQQNKSIRKDVQH